MSRTVTVVLAGPDGAVLGALPPVRARVPYWPEVWDVIAEVRERLGLDVTVLRILSTEPGRLQGGAVAYLAEVAGISAFDGALRPLPPLPAQALADHPLRAPYACPGGPASSLHWARHALDRCGRGPLGGHEQRKTWNLSAIWRLATPGGPVWLKQVPRFFAHEAAVLTWLAESGFADIVVGMVAEDGGRMLLDHLPGDDLFGSGLATRLVIAERMHAIHIAARTRVQALLARGVPDRRAEPLARSIRALAAEQGGGLAALVGGLDERLAAAADCGLPDTLVHGDLHPGNARGAPTHPVLLDWGDSCIAHPAFDLLRLADGLDRDDTARLTDAWVARWRRAVPGCDPRTALELLRPVAALRNATVYAHFLANIEPSEHRYHAGDVRDWLARAAAWYGGPGTSAAG